MMGAMPRRRAVAAGQRFGRLTVVGLPTPYTTKSRALVRCDCGSETHALIKTMISGATASCGCLRREVTGARDRARVTTHGGSSRSEYRIWINMRIRCDKPSATGYENYGGRGIRVCERWHSSFANFVADMGPRPSSRHQLDRIDNDGHYEPGNVRWALPIDQLNNRRVNVRLTHDDRTQTVAQWARELGCTRGALRSNLKRHTLAELIQAHRSPRTE